MNKKALWFGLIYCVAVIIFKLVIILGGYTLTKFGFYYSHILSVFFIVPFLFIAVYMVREKDRGGIIGGKESVRIALTVVAVAIIGTGIYNYIEFDWKFKDISSEYYRSAEYLNILKAQQVQQPDKLKTEDFPKIIEEQISGLSAFKATTGKIIPLLFIGLTGAFITAVMMKKSPK
jgi:hypothetical protein